MKCRVMICCMDGSSEAKPLGHKVRDTVVVSRFPPVKYTELPKATYTSSPLNKCQIYDAFNIAQSPIEGQRDENIDAVCGPT